MKLKLKMTAVAVALMAAGAAHADFVAGTTGTGNSTLGLLAWNTATSSYYLRDLGYTLNTFLPTNGASITPSGELTPVFDKTPEAGLTIDKTTNANFADAAFSTWLSGQTAADVRWTVIGADRIGLTATNRFRQIGAVASGTPFTPSNGQLDNGTGGINQFAQTFAGISTTGTLSPAQLVNANGNFSNTPGLTSLLDGIADLYYWVRSTNTGSTSTLAQQDRFGNSANFATIKLASNGDVTYALAPAAVAAVPLPAAAWLMGAGLMGIGGAVRRRRAAEAA